MCAGHHLGLYWVTFSSLTISTASFFSLVILLHPQLLFRIPVSRFLLGLRLSTPYPARSKDEAAPPLSEAVLSCLFACVWYQVSLVTSCR